ncbi:MAG: hypothetical protein ACMVY4_14670 [Minwuia sp.]|uniref:hypothetical protein n=1 Tax=Minwuia sp. TaxID=2493630 RepID=UPI003A861CFC
MMKRIFLLLCGLLAAACESDLRPLVTALQPPAITADPIPRDLRFGGGRTLTAALTPPGAAQQIVDVELRVARDRDASRFDATTARAFPVASVPASGGQVSVTLPASYRLSRAQLLSAQWNVNYRLNEGTEIATVTSQVVSNRLDCRAQDVNNTLTAINAIVRASPTIPATLNSLGEVAGLIDLGFVPSHQFVSFRGMGVAFAHASAILPPNLMDLVESLGVENTPLTPSLLFYAPNPASNLAQVTEPFFADIPMTLIGIAFARPYTPAGPPAFGCLPREAWFVHNAGWHMPDGSFINQVLPEVTPGDAAPAREPRLPIIDIRRFGVWHPRLWDIHIWLTTPGAVPLVSACNLAPTTTPPADFFAGPSLGTCAATVVQRPAFGAGFPAGAFFRRPLAP